MPKKVRWLRGRRDELEEVFAIVLNQRNYDTNGNRIEGFSWDEVMAMSPRERERVKAEEDLPDLLTPHAPIKYEVDKVTVCPCVECTAAIEDWRRRTGRI